MADNGPREKILDKIKKLLALSKSDNPHEAALAAQRASDLLLKHNLEMADVETFDAKSRVDYVTERFNFAADIPHNQRSWRVDLAVTVGNNNFCRTVTWSNTRSGTRKYSGISFIGKPDNIAVSEYLYTYLAREIAALADREWKRYGLGYSHKGTRDYWDYVPNNATKWKKDFAAGAIYEIGKRLREMRRQAMESDSSTRALVLVTDKELAEAQARLHPNLGKPIRSRPQYAGDAIYYGSEAGKKIAIHDGIAQAKQSAPALLS